MASIWGSHRRAPAPTAVVGTATFTPVPTEAPTVTRPPTPTPQPSRRPTVPPRPGNSLPLPGVGQNGQLTIEEARHTVIPTRDLLTLGMRFHPELGDVPAVVNQSPPVYKIGDERTFWVSNTDDNRHFQITAVLQYITPHAYFWVEKGSRVDRRELEKAALVFERQIYPTDRRVFGEEWEPGVDDDPHITFLHAHNLGHSIAGYFSSADSFPRSVSPYSNETDMFYINLDATQPGDPFYLQVIAHEFQHMIHWHQDRNEDTWLNEGFSVLAEVLNGYPMGQHVNVFLDHPDLQLTGWSEKNATPHYGAAGLFSYYLYERFGEGFIQQVARDPTNGLESVTDVLKKTDPGLTANDVFADWVVANLLNDPQADKGTYGYREVIRGRATVTADVSHYPTTIQDSVSQYGTDYISLASADSFTLHFQGEATNHLAPMKPFHGHYVAWGNRADDSDSRLYTQVDLQNVSHAALTFWTWYDIENLWDYAYVVASTDGGKHWTLLASKAMTTANPYGGNLGVGYTGISGGGDTPLWIKQRIDLTPFAGKKILLGFEYVTDDAYTRPGFFVDDVRVDAAGLQEDFEGPLQNWVQEGFIRTDTLVPQSYLVQLIQKHGHDVRVQRYVVTQGQPLEVRVEHARGWETTVAISGLAPLTWESAPYTLTLSKEP